MNKELRRVSIVIFMMFLTLFVATTSIQVLSAETLSQDQRNVRSIYDSYKTQRGSILVDGQPISAICDQHQIHPTLFYSWQKTFFENGAAAFDRSPRSRRIDLGTHKVEQLEARLKRKDEVIAAVTEELVRTKKELGED